MISIKKYLIQVIFGLSLISVQAQNEPVDYNFVDLPRSTDPPIADFIVSLDEASDGNIWMGTMGKGAICYDGKNIRYVTSEDGLIENTVVRITEDLDKNLWFGSHLGVTRYDGDTYTRFGSKDGLTGAGCAVVVLKNGDIWVKSNDGVFRFVNNSFVKFELPLSTTKEGSYKWEKGKVWTLLEDNNGTLWFGLDGYGLVQYDGQNFIQYTMEDGLCSNNVASLAEDQEGNIWIGCLSSDFPEYKNHGGLCKLDGKRITSFKHVRGLSKNDIYTLHSDQFGGIWIGVIGVGVYYHSGGDFSIYNRTDRPDLIGNFGLQSFLEDKNGQLWFGFSGGLFQLNNHLLIHKSEQNLND